MKFKPLTTFKVKAKHKTSLYWIVNIWGSFSEMQSHCDWVKLGRKCRGAVSPYKIQEYKGGKVIRTSPVLGQINLLEDYLGMEVITHESCHAALYFLDRRKVSREQKGKNGLLTDDSFDEQLCYSCGFIAAEIVRNARNKGLIE